MSMSSVCEVFDIADERGISWADVEPLSDEEAYRLFYPERHTRESIFAEPDWAHVHAEMAKVGVNLRLLHDEYREECRKRDAVAMGYTKFCGDYGSWAAARNLTKRIEHKAGQSCEVDWSGPTLGRGLLDPTTGKFSKIYLFVGVLPFSQKAYFEPTLDMRQRTWLRCHVHMYEYWGGVPERTICDNLKTGVTKHPREGEIVLNDAYEALGEHYMTPGLATLGWTVSRGPMEGGSMADPKHPRHFTDDFKRQIVSLYNAGKPPSEIMREYDLGSTTLRRWSNSINATGSPHAADNRTPEQNRIIELERENKRLRMEVDVLKQAALIFARK
ncbi:MAG TPA: transposase [Collinsella ihuae]|uniref:Transposase n=1 Tax=Collinsella ihumii TaxID=1720204 RepID=A0A921LTE7_9ACTN|nr:transposase [Collinsella ihumii]